MSSELILVFFPIFFFDNYRFISFLFCSLFLFSVFQTRCQPMETDVTKSRKAALKAGNTGSTKPSQSSQVVDHFDLFSVGPRGGASDGGPAKRRRLAVTPTKRRKSTAISSPNRSSTAPVAKPKTPKKTPVKKDVFSPVAKKLLDRAKGVLVSPRKSLSMNRSQQQQRQEAQPERGTPKTGFGAKSERDASFSNFSGGRISGMSQRRMSDSASGKATSTPTAKTQQKDDPNAASASASVASAAAAAAASATPKDKERESRSERNKKKLKEICLIALKDRGIGRKETIFNNCFTRLYTISKSFVKDLKSSQNLREEMRKIVESHADLVVTFEKNRA